MYSTKKIPHARIFSSDPLFRQLSGKYQNERTNELMYIIKIKRDKCYPILIKIIIVLCLQISCPHRNVVKPLLHVLSVKRWWIYPAGWTAWTWLMVISSLSGFTLGLSKLQRLFRDSPRLRVNGRYPLLMPAEHAGTQAWQTFTARRSRPL